MKKIFVSGCYEILHAGHLYFFEQARSLGDHLTACVATDETVRRYKGHAPAVHECYRRDIIRALRTVDDVVMGVDTSPNPVFDFSDAMVASGAKTLAVTTDDRMADVKREWCRGHGFDLVVIEKGKIDLSSSAIAQKNLLSAPIEKFGSPQFMAGALDVWDYLIRVANGTQGAEVWRSLAAASRNNVLAMAEKKGFRFQ
jgi:cytidyltransferase-like protein